MAQIDFPNNAVNGQQFLTNGVLYTYNGDKNIWLGLNTVLAQEQIAAQNLTDLNDVTTSNLSTGDLFYYNGTTWINAGVSIDEISLPASQKYLVTNSGSIYKINQIDSDADNPNIIVNSGTTIAFKLSVPGHPFRIQLDGSDYDTGLVHVAEDGTVSEGADAQGKISGTLYWNIPYSVSGEFTYQCAIHGVQNGKINVRGISGTDSLGTVNISIGTLTLDLGSSNVFSINLNQNISGVEFINSPPAGVAAAYTLIISSNGNYDIAWGQSIFWPDGTPPVITSSGEDVISLLTIDGGNIFKGFAAGQNFLAIT